ncbi:peptidoglycan/LPS O-acetylase OafA/YrhL [Zhihengliuella halotolerans]|uniref:Peptidoglycan/LPS O-acetylase OafA/YrhL n=1 Tax=Zhihengliuella halotolerans TaxID=370736 RepID=A0A4Q8ABK5_9MICC|nr:peptidoglycan/LPS O-acetylase OafA/YrhL [Zhihengliuella halotolerans]
MALDTRQAVSSALPSIDKRFRPEIEGLRAVASILVAVYHIYLGRVSGGVDVFFVVAGFLITTTLYTMLTREGRISYSGFFSRLATRLLPHALTVLAVVFAASLVLLPPARRLAAWDEITASALYGENWALIAKATDYLAQGEGSSPVQHFWAMSIQGQFYAIWAVVFALVLFASRHLAISTYRLLVWSLGTLFVVSLAFSIYYTAVDQPVAYFHTGTRVWEFALGGLVALVVRRALVGRGGAVAVWTGLAIVVSSGLLLPVSTSFPGYVALVPALGAVLVIVGSGGYGRYGADRFLSHPAMVWLGGVSYGIYLWHWPLLVFSLALMGVDRVHPIWGVVIIAAAIGLSALTARFVERPVWRRLKDKRVGSAGRLLLGGATILVLVLGIQGWSYLAVAVPNASTDTATSQGARSFVSENGRTSLEEPVVPDLVAVPLDNPAMYDDGCHQDIEDPAVVECVYGAADSERTVVLVGGSHSAHWLPALETIAEDHPIRIVSMTKSSCPWSTPGVENGYRDDSCGEWNREATRRIAEMEPELVVTTATRSIGADEVVPPGYVDRWSEFTALSPGTPIVALRDNPRMSADFLDCLGSADDFTTQCGRDRGDLRQESIPNIDDVILPDSVFVADLTDYFCRSDYCPAVAGNVVIYRDPAHLTATYSRTLAGPLLDQLKLVGFAADET